MPSETWETVPSPIGQWDDALDNSLFVSSGKHLGGWRMRVVNLSSVLRDVWLIVGSSPLKVTVSPFSTLSLASQEELQLGQKSHLVTTVLKPNSATTGPSSSSSWEELHSQPSGPTSALEP